ncbi:MAG: hypothetical protein ACJ777_05605 [Chloroflexota bacterium]
MKASRRSAALLAICSVVVLGIGIPVLAADPSSPPGQSKPDKSANPGQQKKTEKAAKPKTPEVAVTVTGTVQQTTDGKGRPTFTLTANGKTWDLSAGPPWYWGDKNPLKAFVGKSVTVAGSTHEGSTELDVETVDGKAIRAAGKPPWAGGPRVVGPTHPGWKPWMADGKPGKGHGPDGAPGQKKDKTPDATESEAPGS